ncbi:hypothetical protein CAC42_6390 [Sphaceloma murrayae]|uniref:Uncharacterized protein n=1 Tax=Sphaceloma murrayae TaxID=2082308 RepID=A0A2K1QN54_9PEZI|nr:hypothetical protein CAC42_6390 [Sphaceloma murrayae]
MFFKRLSRSRSNSQSYVDDYAPRHDSKANSGAYDDVDYNQRPGSSQQPNSSAPLNKQSGNMYSPQDISSQDYSTTSLPRGAPATNGYGSAPRRASVSGGSAPIASETAPDLLTRAFNEAIRPYTNKLEEQEIELGDLRAYVEQLEAQRKEVHAWIDKRGLRPDVPPSIASQMDASSPHNPTHAAATLNAQLDRKITIVNFDLHRLQDDLNDSLPTPSFSACMLKFLPDISRLTALPSGPKFSFDLLLKLGGNLNSHGGLESGDEEDLRERRSFYAKLDEAMVDVVRGRFREEGEGWGVQREIKRIEKTGAYLRNWGVEPYFPKTLDVMHDGSAGMGMGGAMHGGGTPPAKPAPQIIDIKKGTVVRHQKGRSVEEGMKDVLSENIVAQEANRTPAERPSKDDKEVAASTAV